MAKHLLYIKTFLPLSPFFNLKHEHTILTRGVCYREMAAPCRASGGAGITCRLPGARRACCTPASAPWTTPSCLGIPPRQPCPPRTCAFRTHCDGTETPRLGGSCHRKGIIIAVQGGVGKVGDVVRTNEGLSYNTCCHTGCTVVVIVERRVESSTDDTHTHIIHTSRRPCIFYQTRAIFSCHICTRIITLESLAEIIVRHKANFQFFMPRCSYTVRRFRVMCNIYSQYRDERWRFFEVLRISG